jgi:hypothetical protein
MTAMHSDTSRSGASFVAKRSEVNPRELLIGIIEQTDDIKDKDALFDQFREAIQDDERYQRAIDWYFFVNMYDYLVTSRNQKPSPQEQAKRQAAVDNIKQQITKVVLLNFVLPNGKALRDCTFADCAKAGGWLAKVAAKGKPNQIVGKVLGENELRALMK